MYQLYVYCVCHSLVVCDIQLVYIQMKKKMLLLCCLFVVDTLLEILSVVCVCLGGFGLDCSGRGWLSGCAGFWVCARAV